jgi:hypothetical protein
MFHVKHCAAAAERGDVNEFFARFLLAGRKKSLKTRLFREVGCTTSVRLVESGGFLGVFLGVF